MHDVTLHFGDLQRDWAKFPNAAWGMGFKLLMKYYDQEAPLSDDLEELEYIADAATDEDRRLLQMVLKRAFVHDPEAKVYRQRRADKELAAYQQRCDAAALSNVKKDAKRWPAKWPENIQELTLEQFLDQRSDYQDPITKRLRYSPARSRSAPLASVSEAPDSASAPLRPSKSPFPGNHSPTLPPSHSATFPDTPIVPPGDGTVSPPAVDSDESIPAQDEQSTSAQEQVPASAKKKKGGAALIMPDDWSEARRVTMQLWLDYKAERREGYKAKGFAALCTTLAGLDDKALATHVATSMTNNWAGLFPDSAARHLSPPGLFPGARKKEEGGGNALIQGRGTVERPPPCSEWRWFAKTKLGLTIPEHMHWHQVPINRREEILGAHEKEFGLGGALASHE